MYTYNTCTYAYYTYVYTTEITNFHMGKRNNTILEFSFCDVIYSDLSDKKQRIKLNKDNNNNKNIFSNNNYCMPYMGTRSDKINTVLIKDHINSTPVN